MRRRRSRALAAAVLGTAALGSSLAAGPAAAALPKGMPYDVRADRGASYVMDCKFRAIRVIGAARINQYRVEYRGPTHGNLPSDNARCVLTKVSGPGAIVLTLVKNGQRRSVTATRPGAPVKLMVL